MLPELILTVCLNLYGPKKPQKYPIVGLTVYFFVFSMSLDDFYYKNYHGIGKMPISGFKYCFLHNKQWFLGKIVDHFTPHLAFFWLFELEIMPKDI